MDGLSLKNAFVQAALGAWHGPWKNSISEDAATGISFFKTSTSNSGLLIHSDFWVR